jgi:DNA polymerase III delta prime subunit
MLFKWLKLNINLMYTLNCLTNINLNVIKATYIMNHCPWVEKYRPSTLENIVLDDMNKTILQNIIIKNTFPNLLFYGPPGTGKTTTIINLIEKYQEVYNQQDTSLKIHLNASDERGIEVIRNQINNFVNTKTFFTKGLKFVILDEVDYMTKNAQQALHYLIQQYSDNIRFCLICNYVSKIDSSLQNEFIHLRFSQLPETDVFTFLKNIVEKEQINISDDNIKAIISIFKSDIRSMINFIQGNHDDTGLNVNIMTEAKWQLFMLTLKKTTRKSRVNYIKKMCIEHNMEIKSFILDFFLYVIKTSQSVCGANEFEILEFISHSDIKDQYLLNYMISFVDKHL